MTDGSDTWFDDAVAALLPAGAPRTWSVIVSLMGDMLLAPNDHLTGAQLTKLLSPAGVRPEAMRVALHRLRSDGWIETTKRGRTSQYSLSRDGRHQTEAARPIIYASQSECWPDAQLGVAAPGQKLSAPWVRLAGDLWVSQAASKDVPEVLAVSLSTVKLPDWARQSQLRDGLKENYASLGHALQIVTSCMQDQKPSSWQIVTLRMLIVHQWRRLVLSHKMLPDLLWPEHWPGPEVRALVADCLNKLPRPDLTDLTEV